MFGCRAAYSSNVSVRFVFSISEMCFTPSASSLFTARLQTRVESKRHWLLTAKASCAGESRVLVRSSVLQRGDRSVNFEGLSNVLGTLCTSDVQVVLRETASASRIEASLAADSKRRARAGNSRVWERRAAYSSEVSDLLTLRASATCLAPSGPR